MYFDVKIKNISKHDIIRFFFFGIILITVSI